MSLHLMDLDGVQEISWEPLEGLLGASWSQLAGPGYSWGLLWAFLGGLAEKDRDQTRHGAILGPSRGLLGAVLGLSWGHLGALLGPSWAILSDIFGPGSTRSEAQCLGGYMCCHKLRINLDAVEEFVVAGDPKL